MRQGRRDRRASGGRFSREPARQEAESAGDGVGDRAQSESEKRAGGREGGPLTAARVGRLTVDRSDSGNVVAPVSRPRSRLQTRSGRRFAVAGVLTFPSAPSRIATRAQAVLDGAIVALALVFISWAFGLASIYQQNNQSLLTQLIGAAYPVGDVIVIAALMLAMRRATPQQ